MRVLAADETGLLKVVDAQRKVIVARCGVQTRANAVAHVTWLPAVKVQTDYVSPSSFAALTRNGTVEVWDSLTSQRMHACANAGTDGALLACTERGFVTVSANGDVRVFDFETSDADAAGTHKVRIINSCAFPTLALLFSLLRTLAVAAAHPTRRPTSSRPKFTYAPTVFRHARGLCCALSCQWGCRCGRAGA